jgi:hypothetical protein
MANERNFKQKLFMDLIRMQCTAFTTNFMSEIKVLSGDESLTCLPAFHLLCRGLSIPIDWLPDDLSIVCDYASSICDYYLKNEGIANKPLWLCEFEEFEAEQNGENRLFIFSLTHFMELLSDDGFEDKYCKLEESKLIERYTKSFPSNSYPEIGLILDNYGYADAVILGVGCYDETNILENISDDDYLDLISEISEKYNININDISKKIKLKVKS